MGKKRKTSSSLAAASTIDETSGLHSVSDESRRKIFNAAAKALGHEDKQIDAPHWKLLVNENCPDVFYPVVMTGVEKSAPVTFYMANVPKLMQHVMANCTGYSALVDKACKEDPTVCFDLVVYNDEATGGNLLQPDTSKKASLWYFALRQVQWLWTDVTWHPLCLIQHTEFDKALGGFSAIVLRIIRELEEQNLAVGFPCTFPGGKSILKCQVKWIISDLDSIRGALSLKGSSAMRCCMFCRNVIKKHAGVTDFMTTTFKTSHLRR